MKFVTLSHILPNTTRATSARNTPSLPVPKTLRRKCTGKHSISYDLFAFLFIAMEETLGSERFSFGDVQDTEYIAYDIVDTEVKLPYNPFVFELKLTIFKSKPNYEEVGASYPLSR
jgi:hypothetical protein